MEQNSAPYIRAFQDTDFPDLYKIFTRVNTPGDAFPYPANTSEEVFKSIWMQPYHFSYVILVDDKIAGGYFLKPPWPGRGAHVATGSYMVNPDFHGRKLGYLLGMHSIEAAKMKGFQAMQFNFVISTNTPAVSLWQKLGFKIIGTLPRTFNHVSQGLVDSYVMHRFLDD